MFHCIDYSYFVEHIVLHNCVFDSSPFRIRHDKVSTRIFRLMTNIIVGFPSSDLLYTVGNHGRYTQHECLCRQGVVGRFVPRCFTCSFQWLS